MKELQLNYSEILSILLGITITRILLINRDFLSYSRGYIWKGIIKIWHIIFLTTLINIVFAYLYYNMVTNINIIDNQFQMFLSGIFIGYISVISPNILFRFINFTWNNLLFKKYSNEKTLNNENLRYLKSESILNINLYLHQEIVRTKLFDKMSFLFQNGWWNLNLGDNQQFNIELSHQRLRFLYELEKKNIAKLNNCKHLMITNIDNDLSREFILLVEYFGRKELKNILLRNLSTIKPNITWKGEDRRLRKGISSDRENSKENNNCRLTDNLEIDISSQFNW